MRNKIGPAALVAIAVVVAIMVMPATAAAQTTVFNPTRVEFNKSADHATQLADGTNILTGYRLKHYLSGATTPLMVVDLCKPVPNAAGVIIVTTSTPPCPTGGPLFASPLATNTTYLSRVTAYGPGGESAVSAPSNPFVLGGAPAGIAGSPIVQ